MNSQQKRNLKQAKKNEKSGDIRMAAYYYAKAGDYYNAGSLMGDLSIEYHMNRKIGDRRNFSGNCQESQLFQPATAHQNC